MIVDTTAIAVYTEDIPADFFSCARQVGVVAWDIETSGLDWQTHRIAACQLHIQEHPTVIVRVGTRRPELLCQLLQDEHVTKIFHHAMFDLRFMSYWWKTTARRIACTKIASKLLNKEWDDRSHSLKNLLRVFLNLEIDKSQQRSDWTAAELTAAQLSYAARDVMYLAPLLDQIESELMRCSRLDLAHSCFLHVPTRVELELGGFRDVYTY